MGSVILQLLLIYMLLSDDVTYASNIFGTYINVLFSLSGFETQTCTIICEPIYNITFAATLRM